MGGYWPRREPEYDPPEPGRTEPAPEEKDLLCHYHLLRMEISNLEEIVGDEKELDKAVVLLKVSCKLIKKRLRKIGFRGPLRVRKELV